MRLTSQTSLLMSGMSSHKFLQSTFQFGFLLLKPCLFPLKSSLEFVLHRGKPKFISLPVTLPVDRSKLQFCTTARMKLIIIFYANCTAVFVFFFSKPSGRNNAKYAFQYTFKNNTTQYPKKKDKKRKNKVGTFMTIFAVGYLSSS